MKKYIRNYLRHHNLTEVDFIGCKMCHKKAWDFHHIYIRGMGGRKTFSIEQKEYDINDPINLIPLCREHHFQAHGGKWTKEYLINTNKS